MQYIRMNYELCITTFLVIRRRKTTLVLSAVWTRGRSCTLFIAVDETDAVILQGGRHSNKPGTTRSSPLPPLISIINCSFGSNTLDSHRAASIKPLAPSEARMTRRSLASIGVGHACDGAGVTRSSCLRQKIKMLAESSSFRLSADVFLLRLPHVAQTMVHEYLAFQFHARDFYMRFYMHTDVRESQNMILASRCVSIGCLGFAMQAKVWDVLCLRDGVVPTAVSRKAALQGERVVHLMVDAPEDLHNSRRILPLAAIRARCPRIQNIALDFLDDNRSTHTYTDSILGDAADFVHLKVFSFAPCVNVRKTGTAIHRLSECRFLEELRIRNCNNNNYSLG